MKENLKLREDTFRKMGWVLQDRKTKIGIPYQRWASHVGNDIVELPPIETTWEVTAKYLVPFMRERNYNYSLSGIQNKLGMVFIWYGGHMSMDRTAEIKSDNIALAACESFLEVKL